MDIQATRTVKKTWDIFCKVIDNYGDIGVCWRLCLQLAARGQTVRLIVDDARALAWMASPASTSPVIGVSPAQTELVEIIVWDHADQLTQPADVVIESFGCELPESYIRKMSLKANTGVASHWINLEYLSAEPYAECNHKLPSPVMSGVGKGLVKTFFYPGFTAQTGGLLREQHLPDQQATFDKTAWFQAQGIEWRRQSQPERIVSLFCYEPPALANLVRELGANCQPTLLLVTAGRASQAVQTVMQTAIRTAPVDVPAEGPLRIHYLPYLSQNDYDHLLWSSDANFVRGEDSLVRAIWAGKPFVWQIYPQDDDAHHMKLNAFLTAYLVNSDADTATHIRTAHHLWNGMSAITSNSRMGLDLPAWSAASHAQSGLWADLPDLVSELITHALG